MKGLQERLAARDFELEITPAAKMALAQAGHDPQFGARPLKRVIQQRIENLLAGKILAGEITPGETIVVDYEGKSFVVGRHEGPEVGRHEVGETERKSR